MIEHDSMPAMPILSLTLAAGEHCSDDASQQSNGSLIQAIRSNQHDREKLLDAMIGLSRTRKGWPPGQSHLRLTDGVEISPSASQMKGNAIIDWSRTYAAASMNRMWCAMADGSPRYLKYTSMLDVSYRR